MKIIKFDTINSTNTYALENFDKLENMSIIIANTQTNGRGRFDRTWESSEKENIYLSIILKPENLTHIANITQYLSVVLCKTIKKYNLSPQIKWPNDVLINNKKVCGILCEASRKDNKINGLVLGVGINLNTSLTTLKKIEKPATSLKEETNKFIEPNNFLEQLLKEFEKDYESIVQDGFALIKNDYDAHMGYWNKKMFIQQHENAEKEEIIPIKTQIDGSIVCVDSNNKEKVFYSGDLIL
jgi:BirA family biotin operon repressor/biotin-[acetyl-CoA-carboxylase] ligase